MQPTDLTLAFDRNSVRSYDDFGRLHVAVTNISKATVNPYLGREIPDFEALGLDPDKVYRLFRDPEELAAAAATFNNVPLLSKHVAVSADDHQPALVIGSTGTDAEFADPYLRNSLVIWARDGIDAVESEVRKELSSSYRYRADMTPGSHNGEHYDGVMRDIVGNHVSLVPEGRAGPDVVVGDSLPMELSMKNETRKSALVHGAVLAYLRPRLAADAKIDLAPVVKGITAKNFAGRKPAIAEAVKKLAADADIADLAALLDTLESTEVPEAIDADPVIKPTDTPDPAVAAKDVDAGSLAKIKEFLKGKVSDEDLASLDALCGNGAMDADEPVAAEKDKEKPDMVTRPAMDEAIAAAVKAATESANRTQREIRDAERAVRPRVGDLAVAHDSAEAVYRTALTSLGVKVDGVHPSAFRALFEALPAPSAPAKKAAVAMDAAGAKSYADMFPGAERIGHS